MPPWIMCDDAADAPGDVVVALDEDDVDALQGEVAERGDAVDAAADDERPGRRARSRSAATSARVVGCAVPCWCAA